MKKFADEIKKLTNESSSLGKRPNSIVLYGSSTFTIWQKEDIKRDLQSYEVINCGFGGSTAQDALDNVDDVIMPLNPKAVFYYEGANDIALGQTAEESLRNTTEIYTKMKNQNENIVWIFLFLHLCPGRPEFHIEYKRINDMYKELCNNEKNFYYVDSNDIIYDKSGNIDEGVYLDDGIHFTSEGYIRFGKLVRKRFDEIFKQKKITHTL